MTMVTTAGDADGEGQQQQQQEGPYLTHIVRHHNKLTLIAPDNMGTRRISSSPSTTTTTTAAASSSVSVDAAGTASTSALHALPPSIPNPTPAQSIMQEYLTLHPDTGINPSNAHHATKKKTKKKKKKESALERQSLERERERIIIQDAVFNAGRNPSPSGTISSDMVVSNSISSSIPRMDTERTRLRSGEGNRQQMGLASEIRPTTMREGGAARPRSVDTRPDSARRQYSRVDVWQGLDLNDDEDLTPPILSRTTGSRRPSIALRTASEPIYSSPPPAYLSPVSLPLVVAAVHPSSPPSISTPPAQSTSSLTTSLLLASDEDEEGDDEEEVEDDPFVYNASDPLLLAWEADRLSDLSLDERIARDLARRIQTSTLESAQNELPLPSSDSSISLSSNIASSSHGSIDSRSASAEDETLRRVQASSVDDQQQSRIGRRRKSEIERAERASDPTRVARALSLYAGSRFAAAAERRIAAAKQAEMQQLVMEAQEEGEGRGERGASLVPMPILLHLLSVPTTEREHAYLEERTIVSTTSGDPEVEEEEEEEEETSETEVEDRTVTSETKRRAAEAAQKRIDDALMASSAFVDDGHVTEDAIAALPSASPSTSISSNATPTRRRPAPLPPVSLPLGPILASPPIPDSSSTASTTNRSRRAAPPPPPSSSISARPPLPTPPFPTTLLDAFTEFQRRQGSAVVLNQDQEEEREREGNEEASRSTSTALLLPTASIAAMHDDLEMHEEGTDRTNSVASSSTANSLTSSTSSSIREGQAHGDRDVPEQAREGEMYGYTDLDLLVARLQDDDAGRNYDELLLLGEVLGSAAATSASSTSRGATLEELESLDVARVELDRKRIDRAGKVKLKLSVVGLRCNDCSICLSRFKEDDSAVVLPICLHIFHSTCIQRWLVDSVRCPLCRGPVFKQNDIDATVRIVEA